MAEVALQRYHIFCYVSMELGYECQYLSIVISMLMQLDVWFVDTVGAPNCWLWYGLADKKWCWSGAVAAEVVVVLPVDNVM